MTINQNIYFAYKIVMFWKIEIVCEILSEY